MSVVVPDDKTLQAILKRGVAEIIPEEEFVRSLKEGKPLRLKQGFDPSAPDIHLGHVVGLRKLRQLQELGHQVVLIVGDWTAQIGDPSGRSATRPMLTADAVKANAETYMQQFFKVVDRGKSEVRWQSEWFGSFGLADIIRLTSRFTVAQLLARDDFATRYKANRPIAITELLYPLLQAYDSVMVQADVEFGGTDQRFNNLLGRELQAMVGQRPQRVFLVPLLVGTDGVQKMSKSLGNYIGVTDQPSDMYGKVMSLPDSLIMPYFELVTDVSGEELEEFRRQLAASAVNPMLLKKRLAREIVAQFHGAAAREAEAHFEQTVQKRQAPEEITTIAPEGIPSLRFDSSGGVYVGDTVAVVHALGLVPSRGEARRLLAQGAIEVDGTTVREATVELRPGSVVRVGKRRFARIGAVAKS